MKNLMYIACLLLIFFSCSKDEEENQEENTIAERTVIVYMAAENNLSSYANSDISEMLKVSGSLPQNVNLVAFVDLLGSNPYVVSIKNGVKTVDENFHCQEDFYSCDPEKMKETLEWIINRYPANSYGLVLWGHASGWLVENDTIANYLNKPQRAYGVDTGNDINNGMGTKWINIPSLANVLENLPVHFRFIFADCCNFQCIEVAYELRHVADYIIASPAETPIIGAPYDIITPYFYKDDASLYKGIVDGCNAQVVNYEDRVPMSVIQTDELESFAAASKDVMMRLTESDALNTDGIIYYRGNSSVKVLIDMNDIIRRHIGDDEAYLSWKESFDKAVPYKALSKKWLTEGFVKFDFSVTDERFGGVGVFVPQTIYDQKGYNYNKKIRQLQWYYATGLGGEN